MRFSGRADKIIREYLEPEYFLDQELYGGLVSLIEEHNASESKVKETMEKFKPVTPDYMGLACLFFPAYGSFMMRQILGNGWKLILYQALLYIITGFGWGCILRYIVVRDQGMFGLVLYILIFIYWSWFFRKQSRVFNVVNLYTDFLEVVNKKETT